MEPSRRRRPIIQRSKGAGTVGLVVTMACAGFGVGGAAAGDGSYARQMDAQRLADAALAHRTPAQLVLGIEPKLRHVAVPAPVATAAEATAAPPATPPEAITSPTSMIQPTTTTPAAGTTASETTTTQPTAPQPATPQPATAQPTTTNETAPSTTAAATLAQPVRIRAAAPAKARTTNTTSTINTASGTTTTWTTPITTTDTTTTDTTSTDTTSTSTTDTTGTDGFATPAQVLGSLGPVCHGRCIASPQTSGAVPAAVLFTNSQSTSSSFPVTAAPVLAAPPAPTAAVSAVITTFFAAPPTAPATSPSNGTQSGGGPASALRNIFSSAAPFLNVTRGNATGGAPVVIPIGTAGASAATTGLNAGPTAPAAGTLIAAAPAGGPAAPAGGTASSAGPSAGTHHAAKKQPTSGPFALENPLGSLPESLAPVAKWIPIWGWVALGVAAGLALVFAALALRTSHRARRREKQFAAISAAAETDALTGVPNRRGFMGAAERELARASRYGRSFVVAYVDVRGLKAVNDTEGHLVGDQLIKTVAGLMKESARADDVVGRIGGDEFALLVAEQTAEGAEPVLRRIRARVDDHRAAMEIRVPWELTIGIAAFPDDGTTLDELLGVADRRLYEQRGIALR